MPTLLETFWDHVDKTPYCWNWRRATDEQGYGTLRVRGKKDRAHRVAYVLTYGEIPPGLYVMHDCDNPRCVRPDHLFLGTSLDNNRDMWAKGRARPTGTPERTWCKLDDEQAKAVVARVRAGESQTAVARSVGVSQQLVSRLVSTGRKHW